ncbi:TIGR03089 family protein [Thermobifida halotolerans]|uniref:TIGR03089 family protein n=1 Tax=Thermobifida halotolerans TaxID=483545 RepID=A0A399G3P3_9ACTN|nr:TIGR03089 family protein [Thermobifida halotolerans]UOE18240.1 TIGR03089 family protein [Thermobifida halotolerans]
MSARTPGELWRAASAVDATRPFLTSYDAATDARVEMSFATFDNWVAKTANMLVDGLGALPGERVALALPLHWQSLAWVVACWSAGTAVVLADRDRIPEADVVVADRDRLDAALDSGAREVVGASLHPLGLPLGDCPPVATDYTAEVRGYGDRFPAGPVDPGAVALVNGDIVRTGAELVANGGRTARVGKLTAGDRVAIITSDPTPLAVLGDDLSQFLGVLSAAAAMVLVPGPDSTTLQSRLGTEHVTAAVGDLPDRLLSRTAVRSLP